MSCAITCKRCIRIIDARTLSGKFWPADPGTLRCESHRGGRMAKKKKKKGC